MLFWHHLDVAILANTQQFSFDSLNLSVIEDSAVNSEKKEENGDNKILTVILKNDEKKEKKEEKKNKNKNELNNSSL